MNEQKGNNRYIVKLGLTLFIITSVTALLLAGVNAITVEPIENLKVQVRNNAIAAVMPDSAVLDDRTITNETTTIYTLQQADGELAYCVEIAPQGFGGPINMIVGIEIVQEDGITQKRVTGVSIVSMSETAGLGSKAKDEKFTSQFKDKTYNVYLESGTINTEPSNLTVSKNKSGDIDAISGATITSKAVTGGVNMALDALTEAMIKEGLSK